MLKLTSRTKSIPYGLRFFQPELPKWKHSNQPSFEVLVGEVLAMRKANPYLANKNGWKTDKLSVENEVDLFNARLCQAHGWTDYITTDAGAVALPKHLTPLHQSEVNAAAGRAAKIWSGVKTINDFLDSGAAPVAAAQSEKRAAVCVVCPKNGKGDFTRWFTAPASEAIKRQLEKLHARKLATSLDDKINICEVCLCPLKLKVQTPLEFIKAHLLPAVLGELKQVRGCWIPAEIESK